MLEFPHVPNWWKGNKKFEYMETSFIMPVEVIGYDTETCLGKILTQQFWHSRGSDIHFCDTNNVLTRFLRYLEKLYSSGFALVFVFNAPFDVPLLFRKYIDLFMQDDFDCKEDGWSIKVFCSKNWHVELEKGGRYIRILDIRAFFSGSLEKVSDTFGIRKRKLPKPENLGYERYTKGNRGFVNYALQDARLCYQIGNQLIEMHKEFDIPISSSSANLAEKVFRRMFIPPGKKIQYPPETCVRLAEITYHGGKNGYYIDGPAYIHNIYEYDFNAAYGYAMYSLPSFLDGKFVKVKKYHDGYTGVYQVSGLVKPCPYGILYDADFNYYTFPTQQRMRSYCTSYELAEALRTKEFKMDSCKGYIWKPSTKENPLHEYARYFWEKKNSTPKGDIRYIFYKLCLNSLYGKWIQRNPQKSSITFDDKGGGRIERKQDIAGGLYHPFIGSLITGFTRARLHTAEHYFDAIESSTDSVKSRRYDKEHDKEQGLGVMQLEHFKCKECGPIKKANGLFVRNRLNLIMDKCEHILKCALHGYWGKAPELLEMYKQKRVEYSVERMPLIREGLKHAGKNLFQFYSETRRLNIEWNDLKEIK